MRIKARGREFLVQELSIDSSLIDALCSDLNSDLEIKLDGKSVCVKFGVDRMWLVVGGREAYLVKPKTLSREDLLEIVRSILNLNTATIR